MKEPWDLICSNICPPEARFIASIVMWGKVRTKIALAKWNMNISLVCVLCNCHDEDLQHLFFHCCTSEIVWKTDIALAEN